MTTTKTQLPRTEANAARAWAIECARIADDKKAEQIVVLDVEELILITEYFVICTASNRRQVQAIAEDIRLRMKDLGAPKIGIEGYDDAQWVLMDYDDVIVHVFQGDVREHYDLEMLWGDAKRVDWPNENEAPAG